MSFTVDFKITELFVDTRLVEQRVNADGIKMLARAGGKIRKFAQFSLRRRKTSAMPGKPPSVHAQSKVGQTRTTVIAKNGRPKVQRSGGRRNPISLKNILYGVDQAALSMICGPVGLNKKVGNFTVPELMEKGGVLTRQEYQVGNRWLTKGQLVAFAGPQAPNDPTLNSRTRSLHYAPHPFMGPARDEGLEDLPGLWP